MCFVVSSDDSAESKCGDYCSKALEYCSSNSEAYQLMGSYLLSKQDVEVSHNWLLIQCHPNVRHLVEGTVYITTRLVTMVT